MGKNTKKKGILAQMQDESNVTKYDGAMSLEGMMDALTQLTKAHRPQRSFVIMTGERGYNLFDFNMKYGDSFVGRWWVNYHNRVKGTYVHYLSVGRKHGLYKVKVIKEDNEYRFLLLKGTEMTHFFNNITALNEKLKTINKHHDTLDAHNEYRRKIKIADRELEGQLQLIHNRYEEKGA